MRSKIFLPVCLCCLLLLAATKDDKKKGFDLKSFEKSLCCIPKGNFMFEDSNEISGNKIKIRNLNVDSFYMCNHVVSNSEYRVFLEDLKTTDTLLYRKMYPDTLVWRNKLAFMEDMVRYYFTHPAYGNYPVVGVSHEQAEYYCKWLTQRYMKEPKRKFKKAVFKLPTIYQWEYAAQGGLVLFPFPWGGPYLRNSKGQFLANFMHISECSIKRVNDTGKLELTPVGWMGGELNDAADITCPVISYYPNGYGLYNMAGNVSEYVSEVGISKGGSWCDPAYYIQIWADKSYKNAQSVCDCRGFRVAM